VELRPWLRMKRFSPFRLRTLPTPPSQPVVLNRCRADPGCGAGGEVVGDALAREHDLAVVQVECGRVEVHEAGYVVAPALVCLASSLRADGKEGVDGAQPLSTVGDRVRGTWRVRDRGQERARSGLQTSSNYSA
jgi:hypothetical protein